MTNTLEDPSVAVESPGALQPGYGQAENSWQEPDQGYVTGDLGLILRFEGLAVLVLCLVAYEQLNFPWGVFVLAFFAPDLSLFGYFGGARIGARVYNMAHSYIGPFILLAIDLSGHLNGVIQMCLIWIAHIGFDRSLGYGLKYSSGFSYTHLGRVGGRHKRRQQD